MYCLLAKTKRYTRSWLLCSRASPCSGVFLTVFWRKRDTPSRSFLEPFALRNDLRSFAPDQLTDTSHKTLDSSGQYLSDPLAPQTATTRLGKLAAHPHVTRTHACTRRAYRADQQDRGAEGLTVPRRAAAHRPPAHDDCCPAAYTTMN